MACPSACTCSGPAAIPTPGAGWPSYYIENWGQSTSSQTVRMEAVFERFPKLKVVKGRQFWLAARLTWRLDKLFERMRGEVPHSKATTLGIYP